MEKRIIVFSPHPDDETLGVGGTIAKRISEGYEVWVVIMTDGRNAFSVLFGIDSDPTPEAMKLIRKNEARNALKILGVPEKNVLFLEFEDGTLKYNEQLAEAKILSILAETCPAEIYFTYAKDSNSDHRATNRVVRNAVSKSGLGVTEYQYSTTQIHSRIGPMLDLCVNFFRRNMIHVDISKFTDLKKAALDEFNSQTKIISSMQCNPVLSQRRIAKHLRSHEIFYKDH